MRIALMNYGVGNIYSLKIALSREGVNTFLTEDVRRLKDVDAVLLPGVGGFGAATARIPRDELRDLAKSGKPFVGICLGMQLFFRTSEEAPGLGLDLVPGRVRRLPNTVKVPQIGWNTIRLEKESELTEGLPRESWVYFVHSYYPETSGDWVVATNEYGVEYPCILRRGNLIGTQFHPEKSGRTGVMILRNILRTLN